MRWADHSSREVLPCVVCHECDREASTVRRPWPTGGLLRHGGGRVRKFNGILS